MANVRGRQFNSRQPSGLNKLSIDRETFSGSVYAGLVLALSFHNGDLEPDCVEVSTRGGLCARGGGGGGGYLRDTTVLVQKTKECLCTTFLKTKLNGSNGLKR